MAKFHEIEVAEVHKETSDCTVITFNIPENLQEEFKYIQGQYLTLRKIINDEDIRRSYSLCSSPVDNQWKVAVKQIPGGIFSTYANTVLKAGDKLDETECISLIDKLFSTKHPYYCPHGRPIIINLSINDLDKRFERL